MAVFRCAGSKRLTDDGEPFCDYESDKRWTGRCPSCGRFYDVEKFGADKKSDKKGPSTFKSLVSDEASKWIYESTSFKHFDDVIGGGFVKNEGETILFGGQRGCGKTTLLVQLSAGIASRSRRVLYATAEQSATELGGFARRVNVDNEFVEVMAGTSYVEDVIERAKEYRPYLIILDSLQAFVSRYSGGARGSHTQGVAVAKAAQDHCKKTNTRAVIINQLSKQGEFSGSESVEHAVDVVIVLSRPQEWVKDDKWLLHDGEGRVLYCAGKNRYGSSEMRRYMRMEGGVLIDIEKPSKLAIDAKPDDDEDDDSDDTKSAVSGVMDMLAEMRRKREEERERQDED